MNFRNYILRRLMLVIPTFFGITILNFGIIQVAPGGPVENFLAQARFAGGASGQSGESGGHQGSREITQDVVEEIKKQYGFDKPIHIRYWNWLKSILTLDFGYSHTFGRPVTELIFSKFPVSIRFGLTSFILAYLVCIPLGILKALKDNSKFDLFTSLTVFFLYSVPSYMLAILLIVLFSGGSFFDWFPLGGIRSIDSENWPLWAQIKDQLWHMVLPLICFSIHSFATLTLLMKNSIIEEVRKDYVRTARAKGLKESVVIYRHAFRNALIPIATGLGGILTVFFASNLLLETIFNLDGFGKLFYDALLQRDYPVLMAQVVIGAGVGLLGQLVSDIAYVLVDPRISYA